MGTGSPLTKLHLRFGENQNFCISPANAISGSVTMRAVNDNWSAHIPWELQASKFFFDGGNVGIGTTSPLAKLHLLGGDDNVYGQMPMDKSLSGQTVI